MSGAMDRRAFLKAGAAAGIGVGVLGPPARAASSFVPAKKIERYKTLGRTGISMSDISFGSSRMRDPKLVAHALSKGVSYFDSAESYKDGDAETALGEALRPHRKEVTLTSKTKCGEHTTDAELMENLEASLRRLQTDHVDIYFNHAVNDVRRLQNEAWYRFAELAKKQGKIRFTGMSGHGGQLVECLDHALDNDLVDVVLSSYNYGQDPAFYQRFLSQLDWVAVQGELPRVLAKARSKNVGVVVMKTLRGARLNDVRSYEKGGASYAQAALRWVLSNSSVDGLVISMNSIEEIDEYIGASGAAPPTPAEIDLLEEYLLATRGGYCEPGCQACHTSCPAGVEVSEVLRTRMYAVDYGDRAYAREDYQRLASEGRTIGASCVDCREAPCAGGCPQRLDVGRLTREAHRLLA